MILYTFCLIALTFVASCADIENSGNPPDHSTWDQLLKKHVNASGEVDYAGFLKDTSMLQTYLDVLRANPPDNATWTDDERMAFWINAYNAFTVELILKYYPVQSIKDIGSKVQIPFVNTPWDIRFIEIGDQEYDLNNIEHGKLRKEFKDARIHFCIVCASKSCPVLRSEAYVSEDLDTQMTDQARRFLSDASRNVISRDSIRLSEIFKWFRGDFTREGSLISFLNNYSPVQIVQDAKVEYLEYDWSLNGK